MGDAVPSVVASIDPGLARVGVVVVFGPAAVGLVVVNVNVHRSRSGRGRVAVPVLRGGVRVAVVRRRPVRATVSVLRVVAVPGLAVMPVGVAMPVARMPVAVIVRGGVSLAPGRRLGMRLVQRRAIAFVRVRAPQIVEGLVHARPDLEAEDPQHRRASRPHASHRGAGRTRWGGLQHGSAKAIVLDSRAVRKARASLQVRPATRGGSESLPRDPRPAGSRNGAVPCA